MLSGNGQGWSMLLEKGWTRASLAAAFLWALRGLCLSFVGAGALFSQSVGSVQASELARPIKVMVSILPLKSLVEELGGKHVDVEVMVKPGQSPATFEPTSKQLAAMSEVKLFFAAEVPFERAWLPKLRRQFPQVKIIELKAEELEEPGHHHHHGHSDHGKEHEKRHGSEASEGKHAEVPHYWLVPKALGKMASIIGLALKEAMPQGKSRLGMIAALERRQAAYQDSIKDLDRALANTLRPYKDRAFLVYHPAWVSFAARYDLEMGAIEQDGKSPGPKQLAALIDWAKKHKVRDVFVQKQFSQRDAKRVAETLGGSIRMVDPLAEDTRQELRRFAEELVLSFATKSP